MSTHNISRFSAVILLATATTVFSAAQSYYDALEFGRNYYTGTAHSIGMGNAVTAVGGELGMIGINPAAAVVADYSQVSVSGGINISHDITRGTPNPGGTEPASFSNLCKFDHATGYLPNIGASINFDTGNVTGLVAMNVGFVMNSSSCVREFSGAEGIQGVTSLAGWMAARATGGYSWQTFEDANCFDICNDWISAVGYRSWMLSTVGVMDNEYIGATEGKFHVPGTVKDTTIRVAGDLNQQLNRAVSSDKKDYIFNLGFNFSDMLYIGMNIGATVHSYAYEQSITETACLDAEGKNPFINDFGYDGKTALKSLNYNYRFSASASGFYFKIGAICTPTDNLRIGFAYQAPTRFTVKENMVYSASTYFENVKFNHTSTSPTGSNAYYYSSPSRFNFGLAGTLASRVLLSADYEFTNYAWCSFSEGKALNLNYGSLSKDVKNNLDFEHNIRAGIELHASDAFSVRAGYNLVLGGEKAYKKDRDNIFTFGLGYSSAGSFYADLAAKATNFRTTYVHPYDDYIYSPEGEVLAYSPEIKLQRWLFNVIATIGFRF
ncbi:MAG: hypothetical protein MJY62_05210 [Bacteroidales bacterium]|nr:hypothetical protein [Bacteroidales bacterium]